MKAIITLFKSDGANKSNEFPVKLALSHKSKPKRKTIGLSKLMHWNENTQLPLPSHPDFADLYAEILNIRAKAVGVRFGKFSDLKLAMAYLLDNASVAARFDFYKFAEARIDFMNVQGRQGNAEAYKSAIDSFKSFSPELYFEEINVAFLERFKAWKKSHTKKNGEPLKNSTIRNYLWEFRAIYNSAVKLYELKDTRPFIGLFADLPVRRRRAKNIYLNKEGVAGLKAADLEQETYQRAVDLSLLQFYFGGQDLIDIYYLKKKQIYKDRVYFARTKLGAKSVEFDVRIFPCAMALIKKYFVTDPDSEYIFPWRKDRTGYKTFRSYHNKVLRRAVEILKIEVQPKNDLISSKAIRHSFSTIAKFEGIDVDIIRELQGHERDDMDTVYKDKYPEQVRDEAHLRIIE